MVPGWPLVGRDEVLAQVRRLLRRDALGGVVLVGPPGVGKTRLARECLAFGEAAGMRTATVVGTRAARAIPLGALAPLLPADVADAGAAMVVRAQDAMADLEGGRPLLLLVDDAQNLDEASALVVHHLAASPSTFVLTTVRSGESAPAPVVALWEEGLVERVEVGPLAPDAVEQLLTEALGGPVESTAELELWRACEGNVLLLRELVRAGLESHTLVDDSGLWRIVGSLASSSRLSDLVAARLQELTAAERAALELVAFGEPLGLDWLVASSSVGAVDRLVRNGLVSVEPDQRRFEVRLAHPIHGDILRDGTPVLRARAVRRELAAALAATGARRRGDALREAIWRLESGAEATPELLAAAAVQARMTRDAEAASRLAQASFSQEPRFDVGYLLADCLYDLGRPDATEKVLAAVDPLATTDVERGLVAALRSINLYWHLRRIDDALAVVDAVVGSMANAESAAETNARAAVIEATAGRPRAAMERVGPLLEQLSGRAFCHAALAAALSLPLLGRPREGARRALEGAAAYANLGHQLLMFESALYGSAHALALVESGLVEDAAVVADDRFERCLAAGDGPGLAFSALALGTVDLERGHVRAAERWFREAAGMFQQVHHTGLLRWALSGLLFALALQGEVDAAEAVEAEVEAVGQHPARMQEANLGRARGWLAVAQGDVGEAHRRFGEAADLAAAEGIVTQELAALHDDARTSGRVVDASRAEMVAGRIQSPLAEARLAHIAAIVSGDGAQLADAATALAAVGATLCAAEASFAAADAFRRAGDLEPVGALERQGRARSGGCEGAATPGLRRIETALALTRRELEVADLAAAGMASKGIAEQLSLSVRTVDNHLARVYDKLGVEGRAALAAALATVGRP